MLLCAVPSTAPQPSLPADVVIAAHGRDRAAARSPSHGPLASAAGHGAAAPPGGLPPGLGHV